MATVKEILILILIILIFIQVINMIVFAISFSQWTKAYGDLKKEKNTKNMLKIITIFTIVMTTIGLVVVAI